MGSSEFNLVDGESEPKERFKVNENITTTNRTEDTSTGGDDDSSSLDLNEFGELHDNTVPKLEELGELSDLEDDHKEGKKKPVEQKIAIISKFDVIVDENKKLIDNHVGNNRFMVFCRMNLPEYVVEPDTITAKIIDIVENQCVDEVCNRPSRFLISRNESFRNMDAVPEFIKKTMVELQEQQRSETDKKRRRRSSLLRRSLSSGNMLEDQKKRIAQRKSIVSQLQAFDDEIHEEEEVDHFPEPRSVTLERSDSWTAKEETKLTTANPLDVLLEQSADKKYKLIKDHTGSNRLEVMLQLKVKSYKKSKLITCKEIIDTFKIQYSGRFLIETNDLYKVLSEDQSIAVLECLFEDILKPRVPETIPEAAGSTDIPVVQPTIPEKLPGIERATSNDTHKTAVSLLLQRKKRSGFNTRTSITKADIAKLPSFLPHHSRLSRFSSTGDVPDPRPIAPNFLPMRQTSTGILSSHSQATVSQDTMNLPRQPSFRRSLEPARRPTLSAFSQDMIKEMLERLDVEKS